MDQEIKARWVAALRSGRYPQTWGALRTSEGYCCLGVLCDVRDPSLWKPFERPKGYLNSDHPTEGDLVGEPDVTYTYLEAAATLPDGVSEWARLIDNDPDINLAFDIVQLSVLNDDFQYDFNQIADVIEAQL